MVKFMNLIRNFLKQLPPGEGVNFYSQKRIPVRHPLPPSRVRVEFAGPPSRPPPLGLKYQWGGRDYQLLTLPSVGVSWTGGKPSTLCCRFPLGRRTPAGVSSASCTMGHYIILPTAMVPYGKCTLSIFRWYRKLWVGTVRENELDCRDGKRRWFVAFKISPHHPRRLAFS